MSPEAYFNRVAEQLEAHYHSPDIKQRIKKSLLRKYDLVRPEQLADLVESVYRRMTDRYHRHLLNLRLLTRYDGDISLTPIPGQESWTIDQHYCGSREAAMKHLTAVYALAPGDADACLDVTKMYQFCSELWPQISYDGNRWWLDGAALPEHALHSHLTARGIPATNYMGCARQLYENNLVLSRFID